MLSTGISFFAPGLPLGKLGIEKFASAACDQKWESGSGLVSRLGMSDAKRSNTIFLLLSTLSPFEKTVIPSEGVLMHDAAKTLSPSISTMQALQFPSALYPGASFQQRWGMAVPILLATCQIVSSLLAVTFLPSNVKEIFFVTFALSRLKVKIPLENIL
jgi:hypothetical protein